MGDELEKWARWARLSWPVALLILVGLPLLAMAQNQVPDCVHVSGEARWGAGAYNHVVRIQNQCERAARCQVATDVSPQETQVRVAAGQTTELVTFLGSPARAFTPRVSCELDR